HHERPPGHTMNPAHATFIAEALVSETGASGPWREDTAALDDEYLQSLGVTDAIARVRGPRAELPAPS
ncbi:MAG: hypothetical protein JWL83_2715, partial [Actinomycetia bacterium]|nr:hypothetical protein [Actinomycetes bacterium]